MARATGGFRREGATVDDPKPGDLLAALVQPTILGRRSVLRPVETPVFFLPRLTLVLGGARSGKSVYAESIIERATDRALYLATAMALDAEMAARIARHRGRRGAVWATIEEPLELTQCLAAEARRDRPVLVDCLTLWLSNLLHAGRDVDGEIDRLAAVLPRLEAPVVVVANEVGLGIVPENALARAFGDHAGRLNQRVAALAQRVVFIAAGLPLVLKDTTEVRK